MCYVYCMGVYWLCVGYVFCNVCVYVFECVYAMCVVWLCVAVCDISNKIKYI